MRSPRHLWSGAWREESERAEDELARQRELHAADELPAGTGQPAGAPAETPPKGPRTGLRIVAPAVLAAVVVPGAYLLGHHSGNGDTASAPAALPAVAGKPLKPSQGQTRAGAIYALASPAVVSIRTGGGSGTGFLVDGTTTVVTNAHVVGTSKHVTVRFGPDGNDLNGKVLGTDPSSDLAVVRLPGGAAPSGAKPLKLADSRDVRVGDNVVAIGNPFGLDRTETEGIVSGLGRHIQAPNGFEIDDAIQTDAPINPGNSGGPLLDDTGRVIGVNSQIETGGTSSGNLGIGFAVSSNSLRTVVPTLEQGKTVSRPWLGVETTTSAAGGGALVHGVTAGGPAERDGIRAGDVITGVDGNAVRNSSDVGMAVSAKHVGDEVKIKVRRGGQETTVKVKLGNRPAQVP